MIWKIKHFPLQIKTNKLWRQSLEQAYTWEMCITYLHFDWTYFPVRGLTNEELRQTYWTDYALSFTGKNCVVGRININSKNELFNVPIIVLRCNQKKIGVQVLKLTISEREDYKINTDNATEL